MSYIAIKNFSVNEKEFKIGDPIPTMYVEDRLIRGKKIKLASDMVDKNVVAEIIEVLNEVLNEVVPEIIQKEELLIEDSSSVEVITEEISELPVEVKQTKKAKK